MSIEIVADFNQDNLRLYKRGLGIIFNEEIGDNLKKKLKKILSDQEQKVVAVVGAAGETEERVACEKSVLYDAGFSDIVYIQPTMALAAYFGYSFNEQIPVMSVVIGETSTDLAIILGEKILYSGILDVGVDVPERVVVEGDEVEDGRQHHVGDHFPVAEAVDLRVHAPRAGTVHRQPQEDQTGHLEHRDERPHQDVEAVGHRVDRTGAEEGFILFQHAPPPAARGSS